VRENVDTLLHDIKKAFDAAQDVISRSQWADRRHATLPVASRDIGHGRALRTKKARAAELENGDRGGWPPFSKHRFLKRGGCPKILVPRRSGSIEPKVI
jgi:hypothetical protein